MPTFASIAAITLLLAATVPQPGTPAQRDRVAAGPYAADWPSLERYTVPEWYQDAKFGIFIHWGAYCVPGFGTEWYPRQMYEKDSDEYKHHIATYGPQDKFGYKDFIPRFTAEKFDAAQWAALFADAGAKFVVPVAEHHDGFAMYDCSFSDWCAAKMGPKRDIIGELSRSVRDKGLIFGLSSHRAEHWWFFNGGRAFPSDVQDEKYSALYGPARPEKETPSPEFMQDWLNRTCELVDKYQPALVWFDWWIEQPAMEPYRKTFAAYYYNSYAQWKKGGTAPRSVDGVAINYKNAAFPDHAAVLDLERGQLSRTRRTLWQNDTSVSKNSWGYVVNQDYKTAGSLIDDLADIVSKNGCLLLNIGPKSDGTIPEPEQQILREIGRWLKINGEAIYGTRPYSGGFGEGPTEIASGAFSDTKRPEFTSADIRFTTKGDALYAIVLDIPADRRATIKSLAAGAPTAGTISEVSLVGQDGRVEWSRDATGLVVRLPEKMPCDHAFALRIRGLKDILFDGRTRPAPDGTITLAAADATVHGTMARYESGNGKDNIGYWDKPEDSVAWEFIAPAPGEYTVEIDQACPQGRGGTLSLSCAGTSLNFATHQTGDWTQFTRIPAGRLRIDRPGPTELRIQPAATSPWRSVNLKAVVLTPIR